MKFKLYDDGWYRIKSSRTGLKVAHYFFNDKPIHVLKDGCFKEPIEYLNRYSTKGRKCKICKNIIETYSKIGLENRCV